MFDPNDPRNHARYDREACDWDLVDEPEECELPRWDPFNEVHNLSAPWKDLRA